jgi:hypothetical protein
VASEGKSLQKLSDAERMENTPIHVCTKNSFVDWPSAESRRISSCPTIIIVENDLS